TAPAFHVAELDSLVARLAGMPDDERRRELALLHARDVAELRARLEPRVSIIHAGSREIVRVTQPSLTARNHLALEIGYDSARAAGKIVGRAVAVDARGQAPIDATIRLATDAPAPTPLGRREGLDRRCARA